MASVRFRNVVPIGGVTANVMVGSQFEFLGSISQVQVYMISDPATGIANAEIFFGQQLELADGPAPVGVVDIGPAVPDDLVLDAIGAIGDRLVIRLTETGGAATAIVRTLIVITPVA